MGKKETHIMYGFIAGIIMLAIDLIFYLSGLTGKPGMENLEYITYVPFLAAIILNAMAFSKANDGYVTFGNVFGSCFRAAMIVTIVIVAWTVLSTYAFPGIKERALAAAHDKMISQKMTDEQIDTASNMTKKYYTMMMVAGAILGTLFYGALFSLVGALVAKKKGVPTYSSTQQ